MRLKDTGLTEQDIKDKVKKYMIETYERFDFVAETAKDMYMYGTDGAAYLDFYAGIAVNSAGNCNDRVVAAVDNIETRQLLNEACVRRGIPLIDGGISGWGGSLFYVKPGGGPCLACLYPQADKTDTEPAAFGTMAGIIGMAQAQMAVLALTGHTEGFEGKYIWFDGVRMEFHHTVIKPQSGCAICGEYAKEQAGNV